MNEHLRRDAGLTPEQSSVVDPSRPEGLDRPVDRPIESDAGSRPIVTPPPAGVRPVAGSGQPAAGAATATARVSEEERTPLFDANEANNFRARWDSIQVGFVDEPRKAVQEADALVSDTIKRLSDVFASERQRLEQQWDRNENVSTEDFRKKVSLVLFAAPLDLTIAGRLMDSRISCFIRSAGQQAGPPVSHGAPG